MMDFQFCFDYLLFGWILIIKEYSFGNLLDAFDVNNRQLQSKKKKLKITIIYSMAINTNVTVKFIVRHDRVDSFECQFRSKILIVQYNVKFNISFKFSDNTQTRLYKLLRFDVL